MTGDPLFDLIAACYKQAYKEARRGDPDAIEFFDMTAPDWRELAASAKRRSNKQMAIEQEFHAHRGPASIRSNGKHCIPDDDQAASFHQYDDEAGSWTLDCYNTKYTKQLVGQGCKPLPNHSDGQLFVLSTRELIQFLADSEGIPIEFRKRRKPSLTDEQKQVRAERMRALNAERKGAVI